MAFSIEVSNTVQQPTPQKCTLRYGWTTWEPTRVAVPRSIVNDVQCACAWWQDGILFCTKTATGLAGSGNKGAPYLLCWIPRPAAIHPPVRRVRRLMNPYDSAAKQYTLPRCQKRGPQTSGALQTPPSPSAPSLRPSHRSVRPKLDGMVGDDSRASTKSKAWQHHVDKQRSPGAHIAQHRWTPPVTKAAIPEFYWRRRGQWLPSRDKAGGRRLSRLFLVGAKGCRRQILAQMDLRHGRHCRRFCAPRAPKKKLPTRFWGEGGGGEEGIAAPGGSGFDQYNSGCPFCRRPYLHCESHRESLAFRPGPVAQCSS